MSRWTLYVADRTGVRQAQIDLYESAEVIARVNDVSTWQLTLPTDCEAGRILAADSFARVEFVVDTSTETGHWTASVPGADGYLTPTVGTVTTPDPGPVPDQCTFVFKVRGPAAPSGSAQTVCGQFPPAPNASFYIRRAPGTGMLYISFSPGGNTATVTRGVAAVAVTGSDEYMALSLTQSGCRLQSWSSPDGVTWTAGTVATSAPIALFDSTAAMMIGQTAQASVVWDSRIYSVEMRTGLDPAAGTVLWRFDANDYPGSGVTSYVDPRGRTWTLTTAAAITPKVVAVPPVWVPATDADKIWRSGPIAHLERSVDLDGDMLQISGVDDTVWLARRNAHPQPGTAAPPYSTTAYDVHTGDVATVLAELVRVNAGPSAVTARQVPGLVVPVPAPAGPTVTVSARWQNLLQLCQDTARPASIIFDVVDLTFHAYAAVNRGAIFSAGLETLAAWTATSEAATANKVVVAGGGEGAARLIRETQDAVSISQWGLVETFQDRRDSTDLAELDKAAAETLAAGVKPTTVVFTPLDTDGQAFGRDWTLGDVVTVVAGGLTVIDQVREVHVTLDEQGATVIPSVGAPAGDLALFRELAGLDRRVRQLERI